MAHSSDKQRSFELRKAKHVGALCHRFPALETVAQTNSGASGVGAGAGAGAGEPPLTLAQSLFGCALPLGLALALALAAHVPAHGSALTLALALALVPTHGSALPLALAPAALAQPPRQSALMLALAFTKALAATLAVARREQVHKMRNIGIFHPLPFATCLRTSWPHV